jgi:hypothetical protein
VAPFQRHDNTQTQLRFSLADPALADNKFHKDDFYLVMRSDADTVGSLRPKRVAILADLGLVLVQCLMQKLKRGHHYQNRTQTGTPRNLPGLNTHPDFGLSRTRLRSHSQCLASRSISDISRRGLPRRTRNKAQSKSNNDDRHLWACFHPAHEPVASK